MRALVILVSFAPFAWYAFRDHQMHMSGRQVPKVENFLHLVLGIALAGMLATAISGSIGRFLVFLAMMVGFGAVDEFVFHRDIPAEEHMTHAKEHFLLLVFVGLTLAWEPLTVLLEAP